MALLSIMAGISKLSASFLAEVAEKLADVIEFPETEDEADGTEGDGVSSALETFRLLPTTCDTSPSFSKKAATSGSRLALEDMSVRLTGYWEVVGSPECVLEESWKTR